MDRKDRWPDDVFAERSWRRIKYGEMYLHAYDSISAANANLAP